MTDKLWAGRFKKKADETVNQLNASIAFDCKMYKQDIVGSMAHGAMLSETGIIPKEDSDAIVAGLKAILSDIEGGTLAFDTQAEDIHTFVENQLTARIGEAGKKLHTARSRNDQVALDLRLYLRDEAQEIITLIQALLEVLCRIAAENLNTVMPGYTHLQRAQPITLAHHLMAYAQMLLRDIGRLQDGLARMDEMPLGSCALAATTYPIDRDMVAQALGFARTTQNSLDGVSDRDFCLEICSALSILMMHLSRFSEEIILWCSWEFKFIELDDAFATGSSIMPQKKNPDVAELVRGKAGRVFGHCTTLFTMLKGLPLAYNKDMQEDKEALFDALDTTKLCLTAFIPMVDTMRIFPEAMREAAAKGFINATDCADYLTKKGVAFRSAYQITGQLVAHCIENNSTLETLSLEAYKAFSPLFDADVFEAIKLETCIKNRNVQGGPAPQCVDKQIAFVRTKLEMLS